MTSRQYRVTLGGPRPPAQVVLDPARVREHMAGKPAYQVACESRHTISQVGMNRALSGLCLRREVAQHLADTLGCALDDLGAVPYFERTNPT